MKLIWALFKNNPVTSAGAIVSFFLVLASKLPQLDAYSSFFVYLASGIGIVSGVLSQDPPSK